VVVFLFCFKFLAQRYIIYFRLANLSTLFANGAFFATGNKGVLGDCRKWMGKSQGSEEKSVQKVGL
jgi:hypothetical protein